MRQCVYCGEVLPPELARPWKGDPRQVPLNRLKVLPEELYGREWRVGSSAVGSVMAGGLGAGCSLLNTYTASSVGEGGMDFYRRSKAFLNLPNLTRRLASSLTRSSVISAGMHTQ